MIFRALIKDEGKTRVYAVEISQEEIESTPFTEVDQKFFESCRDGPVSRQVLGISILLRKIEDHQALLQVKKDLKWTSPPTEDQT